MNKIIISILVICSLTACDRDESVLNDYELFGRLQSGKGTWEVVSMTVQKNDVKSPATTDITPENTFYHFFVRSEIIGIVTIDYNAFTIYQNESLERQGPIDAERQRVVLDGLQISTGDVWTVEEDNARYQVWNLLGDNNEIIKMRLERCNCDVPFLGQESGG